MPAAQTEQENCVAHNGSLIPVPGRDIMVQAWYQGGVSVFDFTDSAHPRRDRLLRSRSDRREEADHRRLLVDLLVQRQHLRSEIARGTRRLQADAERVPVAERDRRRGTGALHRIQRAAAEADHLAGGVGCGACLPRSARPATRQSLRRACRPSRLPSSARTRFTAAGTRRPAPSRESLDSLAAAARDRCRQRPGA